MVLTGIGEHEYYSVVSLTEVDSEWSMGRVSDRCREVIVVNES